MSTEFESLETQSPISTLPNNKKDYFNEFSTEPSSSEAAVASLPVMATSTLTRMTGRRQKLPAVMPDISLNLWNLLCKNIGKDLSKISMPGN